MNILIDHIYKFYGEKENGFFALYDFVCKCESSSFNVIVGESGSGKSTLLKIIGGLLSPSKGSILVNGTDIYNLNFSALAEFRRNNFGFVFQEIGLVSHLSGAENISFPELNDPNNRVKYLGEYFNVIHCLNKTPQEMSLGEKQRITIARALYKSPKILIADEPTANLDWPNAQKCIELLKNYSAKGLTVLLATHDERILDYASQSIRLKNGKIIN